MIFFAFTFHVDIGFLFLFASIWKDAETIITTRFSSGDLCLLGYIAGSRSKPGSLEDDWLNKTQQAQNACVSRSSCFELHSTEGTDQFRQTTRVSKVFLSMELIHTPTDHVRWSIQRRLCIGSCRPDIMRKVLLSPDVSDRSTQMLWFFLPERPHLPCSLLADLMVDGQRKS